MRDESLGEFEQVPPVFLQVCEGRDLQILHSASATHCPLQIQLLPLPEPLPLRVPAV